MFVWERMIQLIQVCTVAHRGHATYIFISRDKNTVYRAITYRTIN